MLRDLLGSLCLNEELIDGEVKARIHLEPGSQFSFIHPNVSISRNVQQLWAERNWIQAIGQAFNNSDLDAVIILDDDIIVSPFFVGLMKRLMDWVFGKFTIQPLLSSINTCNSSFQKLDHLKSVRTGILSSDNTMIHRKTWEVVSPLMLEFNNQFCGVKDLRHDEIRSWMADKSKLVSDPLVKWVFENKKGGTGRDAMMLLACSLTGVQGLFLEVNRILNKGPRRELGMIPHCEHSGTTLDVFPQDQYLDSFNLL
jgi:hypothetical protein